MKKLNNNGWGLVTFIVYICIFFTAIVLVSYIASKNNLGSNGNAQMGTDEKALQQYKEYEGEVEQAAMKYQKENYPNINNGDSFRININKLDISSNILDRCSGYVVFSNKNEANTFDSYLKCGSYRTSGYSSALDN